MASQGMLQLFTAIDERSAAFLALGMATAAGRSVAVVTTSGTAVANLLPAAVEADRSCQPLLLLTADRPERLKNCGANQTVNQEQFLNPACRWVGNIAPTGLHAASAADIDRLALRGWRHAQGQAGQPPGPVHLNIPFEEPLHAALPDQQQVLCGLRNPSAPAVGVADSTTTVDPPEASAPALDPAKAGVVVAGPWRGLSTDLAGYRGALADWLERSGWPLLADPLAALPVEWPGRVHHWPLLLDQFHGGSDLQVLRLGSMPASRALERWLAAARGPQVLISEGDARPLDPLGRAAPWSGGMEAWLAQQSPGRAGLSTAWAEPDHRLGALLDELLPCRGAVTEPALARALGQLLPSGLPVMLAASSPVRDWMLWSGKGGADRRCFSFRGASGIDGTLSLAMGLAWSLGPMVLLTGDLALLHDANGWLHGGPDGPPLLVILIDNGGGGIFQQLDIQQQGEERFDQLFAMPQRVDPLALAAAHGIPGRALSCLEDLHDALDWGLAQQGPALLRACTDRRGDAVLRQQLHSAAQNEALTL